MKSTLWNASYITSYYCAKCIANGKGKSARIAITFRWESLRKALTMGWLRFFSYFTIMSVNLIQIFSFHSISEANQMWWIGVQHLAINANENPNFLLFISKNMRFECIFAFVSTQESILIMFTILEHLILYQCFPWIAK